MGWSSRLIRDLYPVVDKQDRLLELDLQVLFILKNDTKLSFV